MVQLTATVVTLALATVPLPLATTQVCAGPVGCASTVTAYALPVAIGVEKVNEPLAVTARLFPPLSWSTRPVPARPETVPPIV